MRICTGYQDGNEQSPLLPLDTETLARYQPVYEDLPGWQAPTAGIKEYHQLPENAQRYLKRMEELIGVPLAIISTGAERDETIILNNPFQN